jgi:hypothetical protein
MIRVLIFLALFAILPLNAQMCPCEFGKDKGAKTLRNEIGFNAFNLHEELINFYSEKVKYVPTAFKGFTFKRHFNNYSLRAAYTYSQHDYSFTLDDAMNFNKNDGVGFNHDFRIGIEKTFNVSELQYFAGVDLVYNSGKYNGMTEGFGDFQPYYKLPYNFTTTYYGLSPFVGIKYRFTQLLSASMESGLQMVGYSTNQSTLYQSENGIALMVQPIRSLGINFHF